MKTKTNKQTKSKTTTTTTNPFPRCMCCYKIFKLFFLSEKNIEGLHDAVRTYYTRTILPRRLVSFCMAWYREKKNNNKRWNFEFTSLNDSKFSPRHMWDNTGWFNKTFIEICRRSFPYWNEI